MTPSPIDHPPAFADLAAIEARLRAMAFIQCEEDPGLSELDHALQCARLLELSAPDDFEIQIAGLVHDIRQGPAHDRMGADAVRPVLGERVAALVGLHVEAKRYLVATDPAYRDRLSRISTHTLDLQGGPMGEDEISAFEASPHARDAVRLRLADEAAKVVAKPVKGLADWFPALRDIASRTDRWRRT
jgi:predicted HD phosphohydrolase